MEKGFGIAGAALGTGLSQTAAAFIGLNYFACRSWFIHFKAPIMEWQALGQDIYNGSLELATELSIGLTTFLFNVIAFSWAGEDGVAAMSIILYAKMILTTVFIGFSYGIAPIFFYQLGANNYRELLRLMKPALLGISIFSLTAFACSRILAELLITLLMPDGCSA